MEHEMRLAVLTLGLEDHAHPMVMPYCVGCGWVGESCFTFDAESIPGEWQTHVKEFKSMYVKEFKLMQHARERALIEDVEGSE